jgi:hypothetical protein
MKTVRYASLAILIAALTPAASDAADDHWQVGTAPSFSSGRYGTDSRTEIFHTPITARRLFTDGDLTFVFPFTCMRGNGGVTVVDGSPLRTDVAPGTHSPSGTTSARGDTSTLTRDASTTPTRTTSATGVQEVVATPTRTTSCGQGDIVVRGRYYIIDERAWWPTIALRAHVKAPTADASAGLGTGKPDEGVGIEVSQTVAGGTTLMVDSGYTLIGKPAGAEFGNRWWYDVGIGQDFARGVLNLSVFFEEYSAIVPGLVNARDILAALTVRSASGWRLQFAAEVGLSDSAPDHGFTFGASRRF